MATLNKYELVQTFRQMIRLIEILIRIPPKLIGNMSILDTVPTDEFNLEIVLILLEDEKHLRKNS